MCRRIERLIRGKAPQSVADAANGGHAGDWLDPGVLAEHFSALGPGRTARILEAFEENTEQMLAALAESGAGGDALADPAHRLAGSAAALGLPRLRALAGDLERAGRTRARELDTLSALMPDTIAASRRRLAACWASLCDETSA